MKLASTVQSYFDWFDRHRLTLLEDYFRFLRFESVSADPAFSPRVRACCDWLCSYLQRLGMTVEQWPTEGHPMILASLAAAGPDKPTVMIYNHYDVQPVDPLELWRNPPFEPFLDGDDVYARGASDNKGQCFSVLAGLQALLERDRSLPVNLKLCIEGEEEYGSPNMYEVVRRRSQELSADYLFIVDAGLRAADEPAVTLGCRGIISMTATLTGSSMDLHSGDNGGVVFNPNHALIELLAGVRDKQGRITIPGFYDDVREVPETEKAELSLSFDPEEYRRMFGGKATGGEKQYSPLDSAWLRPTLEVNGMSGGYTGDGFKTVIPAKAMAKISCRLVPDQEPCKMIKLVSDYLQSNVPDGVQLELAIEGGKGKPVRTRTSSPGTKAAARAYEEVCDKKCSFVLTGGSIPISAELAEASKAEVVYLGYALPDDNAHAPNERFSLTRMRQGAATIGRILEILGGR